MACKKTERNCRRRLGDLGKKMEGGWGQRARRLRGFEMRTEPRRGEEENAAEMELNAGENGGGEGCALKKTGRKKGRGPSDLHPTVGRDGATWTMRLPSDLIGRWGREGGRLRDGAAEWAGAAGDSAHWPVGNLIDFLI